MKYQIKQLSLGGILDQSLNILKDNFGLLFGIVGVSVIPFNAILGFIQYTVIAGGNLQAGISIGVIGALIGIPIAFLAQVAVMHAIASAYLSKPTTISDCFRHGRLRFLPVLGTAFLTGLAIMGGFILFVIPGIIFAFWFMLSTQVAVLESASGSAAMTRSRALMKGNVGTAFVLGLILTAINIGISGSPTNEVRVVGIGI